MLGCHYKSEHHPLSFSQKEEKDTESKLNALLTITHLAYTFYVHNLISVGLHISVYLMFSEYFFHCNGIKCFDSSLRGTVGFFAMLLARGFIKLRYFSEKLCLELPFRKSFPFTSCLFLSSVSEKKHQNSHVKRPRCYVITCFPKIVDNWIYLIFIFVTRVILYQMPKKILAYV